MGAFLRPILTPKLEQQVISPKIVFLGSEFTSEEIKSTYSVLNYLQDLAPYNATISFTIEKMENILSATIVMASTHFSTSLAIESKEFNSLLNTLKDKTKEQLLQWKSSRF